MRPAAPLPTLLRLQSSRALQVCGTCRWPEPTIFMWGILESRPHWCTIARDRRASRQGELGEAEHSIKPRSTPGCRQVSNPIRWALTSTDRARPFRDGSTLSLAPMVTKSRSGTTPEVTNIRTILRRIAVRTSTVQMGNTMTTSRTTVARFRSDQWPLFSGAPTVFDILTIESSLEAGETLPKGGDRCARRLAPALAAVSKRPAAALHLLVALTLVNPPTSSRTLSARKKGFWRTWNPPSEVPTGTRIETEVTVESHSVRLLGAVNAGTSELPRCIELTRNCMAACVVDLVGDFSIEEWIAVFATLRAPKGHNRAELWSDLVPRVIERGGLVARATGWFDDRVAGVDVFGSDVNIASLAALL